MSARLFVLLFAFLTINACHKELKPSNTKSTVKCTAENSPTALLASRINELDTLRKIIQIEYFIDQEPSVIGNDQNNKVKLSFCFDGRQIESELIKDISQSDIKEAKEGNWIQMLALAVRSPFAVMNRNELAQIYVLARRRYDLFGISDVAFYDLAEQASYKIIDDSAFLNERDKGEKGYLNSFNHITAQAFITSLYSEELADFIADVHERDNMPEIIDGVFTEEQLSNLNNNPIDNYIDLINNEIGQELGKQLKKKYKIKPYMKWDVNLLTDYLNDLQSYYQYAYKIKMEAFDKDEVVVRKFLKKLNSLEMYGLNS